MTLQEINELITANVKTLSEKYDNHLVQLGRMLTLNDELCDRAVLLKRSIKQLKTSNKSLTSRNKTLTKQLADAKRDLSYLAKSVNCLLDVIERTRQISPEVSARIDEIKDEVNSERNHNQ